MASDNAAVLDAAGIDSARVVGPSMGGSLWNFFNEHKAGLPTDVSIDDVIHVRHDVANTSVDLLIDFRRCPKP
jgi:hypothetical protein